MTHPPCPIGRCYEPKHPTCRTCQIGCVMKGIAKEPEDEPQPEKKSRYRSQKITVDGETFASKKQYARWCQLKMMEKAGRVSDLKREVPFELAPAVTLNGRKKPALRYYADAVYVEEGRMVVEDTKSDITRKDPVYRVKVHLMKSVLGIDVRET